MLRKINLICVGGLKKQYLKNLEIKYKSNINIILLKESNVYKESQDILKIIDKNKTSFYILFDLKGKVLSEIDFSIKDVIPSSKDIYFIIGGSDGVDETVRNRCNLRLKLSDFTYTHQIFRIISILFINKVLSDL